MSSSHNENMLETNNKELISKKIFICLETRNYFYKKKKRNIFPYDPWAKKNSMEIIKFSELKE